MVVWWSRGDLNQRLVLCFRGLQIGSCHNAVILVGNSVGIQSDGVYKSHLSRIR